jgi:hypothetical protein
MSGPGELVTETFDYDGGRQVTAYVPADLPEAIVFAGDGQHGDPFWQAEFPLMVAWAFGS